MIKRFLRRLLHIFNYDIVKHHPTFRRGNILERDIIEKHLWLQKLSFETIIDVGANEGQFSEKARVLFPNAFIHAFEPLPKAFNILKHNFENDPFFKAYNFAIGSKEEIIDINLNESSASSSILPMTEEHTNAFSFAVKTIPISILVKRLDDVLQASKLKKFVLMKIDVQGFEDKVIAGSEEIIECVDMIIVEVSFRELYKDQPLFDQLYKILTQKGFKYCGSLEQLFSPTDQAILQADAIFSR